MLKELNELDHGFVKLLNLSGPVRRPLKEFDASDRDPAITARISFDNMSEERLAEQDHRLLRYLMNNKHWTPVEMVEVWLEMKLPVFVARQFVRHRTACINEVSARYTKLPADWYIPDVKHLGVKSKSNKQGRDIGESLPPHIAYGFVGDLDSACKKSYHKYEQYLDAGVAPELARSFLHVNHYTHWVWKQDLRNMMGFLSLRLDEHAQYEARVYAQATHTLLSQHLPVTMGWLDDQMAPPPPTGLWAWLKRVVFEGV